MTREEIIKSALKFLVLKQTEQGSWGFSDRNDNEISWNKVLEWLDQQPCGVLIDKQAAFIALHKRAESVSLKTRIGLLDAVRVISEMPPAKSERKVGKWHVEGFDVWCTNCGFHPTTIEAFNYCPNCGAKMEVN